SSGAPPNHACSFLPQGQVESSQEHLKTEYVCQWLNEVSKAHFKVFVSCLLPHPPDYARDALVSRTIHLKDGLNRLFCLIPYEVITSEVWDYVMPHWLEAMVNDVPEKELSELKIILSKMLDADMSPLGFDSKKLYRFVAIRFKKSSVKIQKQALNWLQVLTLLDIVIPLDLLFSMFNDGITIMKDNNKEETKKSTNNLKSEESDGKRKIEKHSGIHTSLSQDVCRLLKGMLDIAWSVGHTCSSIDDCLFCESCVIWYQLTLKLVEFLVPEQPVHLPDSDDLLGEDGGHGKSPPEADKKAEPKPDVVLNMPMPEIHSVGGVLVNMPHIMTATVETVTEQLDLAPIIPAEKVVAAVARAVTLTDTDELPNNQDPDILYHMLRCLNLICLHGDALTKAAKDHRGFLIWCQENLTIKHLWDLCNAEHSALCAAGVPLLLHCVNLPSGADVFWSVIQEEFHACDWRVRFVAAERVTVVARFMDRTPLRAHPALQAALANAFCYLVSSMDDANVQVAQRATLYLGTIHDTAIKSLILCLETQFDSVIVDRPMVLQSLYQLHNCLSDRRILTWDFFLNRFDALFLEAQISLEKAGDLSGLRAGAAAAAAPAVAAAGWQRRGRRRRGEGAGGGAGQHAAHSEPLLRPKWPYKRTMSAPASIDFIKLCMLHVHKCSDGHIHSLNAADDRNLVGFIHRIIDLEEADQETMHLLVFLFMQFLSRPDQAFPSDEKALAKTQSIVLRHLYLLLGYNQSDRGIYIPPQRMRYVSRKHRSPAI
ncbi:UNC79 protein, partial [Gryllus bimaculatus]